jgi:hypothetical protein
MYVENKMYQQFHRQYHPLSQLNQIECSGGSIKSVVGEVVSQNNLIRLKKTTIIP